MRKAKVASNVRALQLAAHASPPLAVRSTPATTLFDEPLWEPAFWPVRYLAPSPWIEHVPFAFWVVSALRPRLVVEVGTTSGVSYFAFCQSVDRLMLEARCYAVAAPAEDCTAVKSYNDNHYSSFSAIVQSSFPQAAGSFDDRSIDLLHINLSPDAEDVRKVIDAWLPKISAQGVLLLANTNVVGRKFTVQKALGRLKRAHPALEFFHGSGLAVIGVGPSQAGPLHGLLSCADDEAEMRWRRSFARLGRGHLDRHLLEMELGRGGRSAALARIPESAGAETDGFTALAGLQIRSDADRAALPARSDAEPLRAEIEELGGREAALRIELAQLRSALAAEKRRFRLHLNENYELKLKLRNGRQDSGEADAARRQLNAMQNEVAEKASALNRMGARIAALKEELRTSDRYATQLLRHYEKKKSRTENLLSSLLNRVQGDTDLETMRGAILRHEGASSLKLLSGGIRASIAAKKPASRKAVYFHYRLVRGRKDAAALATIAASGLFDPGYYLSRYEDVAKAGVDPLIHFVEFGAIEQRDPSPYFDTQFYLETYPDVAESGVNPLLHFITRGRQEGRVAKRKPSVQAIFGDWTPPAPPPERVSRDALKPLPKRVVIYTAVSGGYDDLKPPAFRPPHCDFVVFSDQPLEIEGWQVRPLNYLHPDTTRAARFAKLHPHLYFPDYDHSIWIDANINVHGDVREFFRFLSDEKFLGIFVHPLRDCIYVEGEECIKRKKDDPEVINRHVARYREAGFPERAGLWETNVLVRRHNEQRCIDLMSAWWREMDVGSRRDQISLPVVAKQLSVEIAGLGPPQVDARNHPMLSLVKHPGRREPEAEASLPAPQRKAVDLDKISMDVGICVYNSPAETRDCLESLAVARRPQDCIIIVDDASAEPTAAYLDEFARTHDNVKLIRHETNRGYTASANSVLKNSSGDWVVLLNSDTMVPRKSLANLIACGEQFPQIGIVGPLSNAASWQTVPQLTGPDGKFMVNQIPDGLTIDDMERICEDLSTGVPMFVPLVNGFCYAIKRRLIEQIGHFDEENFPQGYGEEDDFCLRAGAAGFLCAIATDAYVFHVKSATFTSDRRKPLVAAGVEVVRRKHTPERLKAAVETLKRHPEIRRMRQRMADRLRDLAPPLVPAEAPK